MFLSIVDFLHLLATVIWIGGMIYIIFVLMPSIQLIEISERGKLMSAVTKRFTVFAWLSIIILIVTGIILKNSGQVAALSENALWILNLKYLLFGIMFIIGILITFVLGPKLRSLAPLPGEKPNPEFAKVQNRISLLAKVNLVLGIIVLACVSFV